MTILRSLSATLALASGLLIAPALAGVTNPAATPGVAHHIKTVFIILMENRDWTGELGISGSPHAPYVNNTLLPMASHAEQYYNPPHMHPSLPNYLWLEAGTNFGIRNDDPPSANAQNTTQHLVTLLKNAGVSWKAYLENSSRRACPLNDRGPINQAGNGLYAVRHEPFTYFNDVTDNLDRNSQYCLSHLRPFGEFEKDLKANTVAQYNWITPNLCNDMHDTCGEARIEAGDKWLADHVPAILKSQAYKDGGVLFITWDEGVGRNGIGDDGPLGMIVLSPFAKGNGYSNDIAYTHGSTLRTIEEIFGVTPLLGDAADQQDLSDLFSVFP
jgi:phospholipase C